MRQRRPDDNPWPPPPRLTLTATRRGGTTYQFRADDALGWALCTVNDETGELLITSDWGNWSHRWDPRPSCLGAPSLTAFIGTRGGVDYLARKLSREGREGRRWSARLTARNLHRRLCERRLEDGRQQLDRRLEPDELPCFSRGGRYDGQGLPIYGRPGVGSGHGPLPYLTQDAARRLWNAIEALAEEVEGSPDLFYERVHQIEGFSDYVTEEPWELGETEQTPENRNLRSIVLPALIEACARSLPISTRAAAAIVHAVVMKDLVAAIDDELIAATRAAADLYEWLNHPETPPCQDKRTTPP
jgi:hypothetical protein